VKVLPVVEGRRPRCAVPGQGSTDPATFVKWAEMSFLTLYFLFCAVWLVVVVQALRKAMRGQQERLIGPDYARIAELEMELGMDNATLEREVERHRRIERELESLRGGTSAPGAVGARKRPVCLAVEKDVLIEAAHNEGSRDKWAAQFQSWALDGHQCSR